MQHAAALRLNGSHYDGHTIKHSAAATVGRAGDAWWPATMDAATNEAAIWHNSHVNAAVYGIEAKRHNLQAFLQRTASGIYPQLGLSTLIRWVE